MLSFVVWSAVYVAFSGAYTDKISLAAELIRGHYHMWFIPMIIGLYICLPILNAIVADEKILKYYFILAFVFAFLVPWITNLAYDFANNVIVTGVAALRLDIDYMYMYIVLGYAGYFILGYYLNKINFTKQQRLIIYLLGLVGFGATIGLEALAAHKLQKPDGNYYGNMTVNVLLESIAVFVWFKYRKYNRIKLNSFVQKLSKYSFGAYLVHLLIIEQLDVRFGLNTLSFPALPSMICLSGFVFVVSFLISGILNQIPIVKKFIV